MRNSFSNSALSSSVGLALAKSEGLALAKSEGLINNNKVNNNKAIDTYANEQESTDTALDDKITISDFEKFWRIYPRHPDKGKAYTAWIKLCKKPNRPDWYTIKHAILQQIKSERWSDPEHIPWPTTWLNNSRWLDDPAEMKELKPWSHFQKAETNTRTNKAGVYAMKGQHFKPGRSQSEYVKECNEKRRMSNG